MIAGSPITRGCTPNADVKEASLAPVAQTVTHTEDFGKALRVVLLVRNPHAVS